MQDLLIVGGGLFGSCAAALARKNGFQVKVFDDGRPGAGSPPAACVFGREWAGKFAFAYDRGLSTLEKLVQVRSIIFDTGKVACREFQRIRPADLLETNPIREKVTRVYDGGLETNDGEYKGFVYVAAGYWVGSLLNQVSVSGRMGTAVFYKGQVSPQMKLWAPYRQAMTFSRDPGEIYFADGTALEKYTAIVENKSVARAKEMFELDSPIRKLRGARPYCKQGLVLEKLGNRLAVGVGGRKFGTILGAYSASKLMEWLY